MANEGDKTIWQLPDIESISGDEEIPLSYNGKNYNVNISQIAEFANADIPTASQGDVDDIFEEKPSLI